MSIVTPHDVEGYIPLIPNGMKRLGSRRYVEDVTTRGAQDPWLQCRPFDRLILGFIQR